MKLYKMHYPLLQHHVPDISLQLCFLAAILATLRICGKLFGLTYPKTCSVFAAHLLWPPMLLFKTYKVTYPVTAFGVLTLAYLCQMHLTTRPFEFENCEPN